MENQQHPTFSHGKICYLQIPAVNINQSAAFFSQVFHWKTRINSEGKLSFDDGVNEVSGTWVVDRAAQSSLGLLVHFMVDDINTTIEAIISNGGQIIQPVGVEAPEITARFTDPAGNIFGIFQQ